MDNAYYALIKRVSEKTANYCISDNQTLGNKEVKEYILSVIESEEVEGYLSIKKKSELVETIYHSINGLGPLQPLIDDDEITEIMINSEKEIFIEKNGILQKIDNHFE
jgi:pilus assembly protein CpaF